MKKDNASLEQKVPRDPIAIEHREEPRESMIDQKVVASQVEKQKILRARSLILARKSSHEQTTDDQIEVIEFNLGSETYAIESEFVWKIYRLKNYTQLPGTPNFVLGIINVGGQIISVLDISKFFNLPTKGLGDLNKVIIIRNKEMEFGILADTVLGTKRIPIKVIQALPPTLTDIGSEYLIGVTAERVIVIDAKKMLNDRKIVVNDGLEDQRGG